MTIIIFLIILSLLVFIHELGHFLAAKKAGVAVEEFGFGYPPRAFKLFKKWGTVFSINWIPFGGFVKIFGENYEETENSTLGKRFTDVSKKWQAIILVAGVTFNIIFAWILFSLGFLIGVPAPVENDFGGVVKNPETTVVSVLAESPAFLSGIKTGDKIKSISSNDFVKKTPTSDDILNLVASVSDDINIEVLRGKETLFFKVQPKSGLVDGKKIIGISTDMVGTLRLPIHKAMYQGLRATVSITYLTALGLFDLVKDSVVGKADLSQVTGPVGIVGLVGDASRLGFSYLITFTSLISINLAIVNLIPFPALDGGRLLFVFIESITSKPISPKIAGFVNTIGFFILIGLMLIVTYKDILKLT